MNAKIVEAKITFDVMAYGGEVNPESYNKMMKKYLGKIMSHFIKTEMKGAENILNNKNTDRLAFGFICRCCFL